MFSAVAIVVCIPLLFLSLSCCFFFNESTASSASSDIRSLDQTYTWSYSRHIFYFQFVQKLAHDTLSLYVEHAFPGVCSWYTNDKLMIHHWPQHFLTSLHKNPTLSQLYHKLQKRTAVKINPEQEENNDADSTYTSTSQCIAQIHHYIAKEWDAIDCSRTLIGKLCYFICYL